MFCVSAYVFLCITIFLMGLLIGELVERFCGDRYTNLEKRLKSSLNEEESLRLYISQLLNDNEKLSLKVDVLSVVDSKIKNKKNSKKNK